MKMVHKQSGKKYVTIGLLITTAYEAYVLKSENRQFWLNRLLVTLAYDVSPVENRLFDILFKSTLPPRNMKAKTTSSNI